MSGTSPFGAVALLAVIACGSTHEQPADNARDAAPVDAASSDVDAGHEDRDGSAPDATCGGPERPFFSGCVVSSAPEELIGGIHGWQLVMTGTVVELGSGEPPGGCFRQPPLGNTFTREGAPSGMGAWLRLTSDAGEDALVALFAAGAPDWHVQMGDRLSIDFRSRRVGIESRDVNHLTMRGADGSLRAWAATGGRLTDLVVPAELSVAQGGVECMGSGECVSAWGSHALIVAADSAQQELATGARARIGSYDAWHGGLEIQTGTSLCDDISVAYAAAAAFGP